MVVVGKKKCNFVGILWNQSSCELAFVIKLTNFVILCIFLKICLGSMIGMELTLRFEK